MAKICDRSPCDALLESMGVWMYYTDIDGFSMLVQTATGEHEIDIDYCPFCGTRLEEVGAAVLSKYTAPRQRRRRQPSASKLKEGNGET